jgi:hypothetical protein
MRKFKLLFLCLLLSASAFSQKNVETQYFVNHPELGGMAVINQSVKEVVGDKTYTTSTVNVPSVGNYFLDFWLMASKQKDASICTYNVEVDKTSAAFIQLTLCGR